MSNFNLILLLIFLIIILILLIIVLLVYEKQKAPRRKSNADMIDGGYDLVNGVIRVKGRFNSSFLDNDSGTLIVGTLRKVNKSEKKLRIEVLQENRTDTLRINKYLILGREATNDSQRTYHISDMKSVSRRHCILEAEPEGVYITDYNSMYHTYVNDEMLVGRRLLKCGDSVKLGMTFTFMVIK